MPAAALASLMPNAPAPGSKEQMIAEEMEKFREKQAQRDKELEDERRRKLQAKVQEAQALEKTISASLDSAKKRTLGMKGGPEKRPKLETPAAVRTRVLSSRRGDGVEGARRAATSPRARVCPTTGLCCYPTSTPSRRWRGSPSRLSRHAPPPQTALAPNAPKLGFSLGGAPPPPRGFKPGLATSAFGAEEASKPRVLQKLDDDESAAPAPSLSDNQSSARAATDEDAKKRDRAIAEAIPTDADQLFKATVDWAAVLLPASYLLSSLSCYVGGARGRRPGQVKTVGRQKNRRVSGGRRTHTDQLHLFLLRAKGQARGDPRRARTGLGRRRADHGRQAVARVTLPRGEGGAAPLCVKNIFAGVFSYPFRRSFWQVPRRRAIAVRAGWRRRRRARLKCDLYN